MWKSCLAAVFVATAVAVPIAAQPVAGATPTLDWQDCAADVSAPAGTQCAVLSVPIDYAKPNGDQLSVAVYRSAATTASSRGALFVLPGGPGQTGVSAIGGLRGENSPVKDFDLISLDPRGVGRTNPIMCPTGDLLAQPGGTDFTAWQAYNARLAGSCVVEPPALLQHLSTGEVAQDLEKLRVAAGLDQVNLYGHSYGTLLGQRYLAGYGEHVRAAVFEGVMDPAMDRRTFLSTAAQGTEDAFGQLKLWCAKTGTCADIDQTLRSVRAKADAGQLAGTDSGRPWTAHGVDATVDGMLLTGAWPIITDFLTSLNSGKEWKTDAQGDLPKSINYADPIVCADYPITAGSAEDVRTDLTPIMGYSPNSIGHSLKCVGWPGTPTAGKASASRSANPALLVNAQFDNATPVAWARSVKQQLGDKAALFTPRAWGHGASIFAPGCAQDGIRSYLTDLRVPTGQCTVTPPDVTVLP
ncbi:alpha/beta fold hydrolase [Pseudonocardiaceae bacterium YIM PH 21723]|nr:alpha/beta fold hydrolase [Pseudonocardiaceae bacterium YIM PH 21723]